MHHKDVAKLLKAGFTLYRCNPIDNTIKCKTPDQPNWHYFSSHKTKKSLISNRNFLYTVRDTIQI